MLSIIALVVLGLPLAIEAGVTPAMADTPATAATVRVVPARDVVWANLFTQTATATLTVDDSANGVGVDYTTTATVPDPSTTLEFDLNGVFDITAGDTVTVDDGTINKSVVVSDVATTAFEIATDVISGTATAGSSVRVELTSGTTRQVVTDVGGAWTADFTVAGPGPGESPSGFLSGNTGTADQLDAEGDATIDEFIVNDPRFDVNYESSQVFVNDFPPGNAVTLTIDDPANGPGIDLSDTRTMPGGGFLAFQVSQIVNGFALKPNQIVTVTDGTTTKTHVAVDVAVTQVDIAGDAVRGTAPAGAEVIVSVSAPCQIRRVTSDVTGHWAADFSTTGPGWCENTTFDLVPSVGGDAHVADADGDTTSTWWRLPSITADVDGDTIFANDFPWSVLVTATIDDPHTGPGVDVTVSQVHTRGPNGTVIFNVGQMPTSYNVEAGDLITVTDGTTTKTLYVEPVRASSFDVATDTVGGVSDPGRELAVQAFRGTQPWMDNAQRIVTVDGAGHWSANFAVAGPTPPEQTTHDLRYDSSGFVQYADPDGDQTRTSWGLPWFMVSTTMDQVVANGWPTGTVVTMTVDQAANGTGIDYTAQATVLSNTGMGPVPAAVFRPSLDNFTIAAGDTVSLTALGSTKTTIVTALAITGTDPVTDTVTGTAAPGSAVTVNAPGATRTVTAASNGTWSANFSVPGPNPGEVTTSDLVGVPGPTAGGSRGDAQQMDADSDGTSAAWSVRAPSLMILYDSSEVLGWQWLLGSSITLTVDRPSNGPGVDWTETHTATGGQFGSTTGFSVMAPDFELLPGDVVTMTDGDVTREMAVTPLVVDATDIVTNTVSGTAEPSTTVDVTVFGETGPSFGVAKRQVVVGGSGHWTANFAAPGPNPGENTTYDVTPNTSGSATQSDADGDQMLRMWPRPPFFDGIIANLSTNVIEVASFEPGRSLTVTIDDPTNGVGVDYTRTRTALRYNRFDLASAWTLVPGQVVSATQGSYTRTLTVADLQVTMLDVDADTISGIAPPGDAVRVLVGSMPGPSATRTPVADGSGHWTADFSVPSGNAYESPDPFDLLVATTGQADDGATIPVSFDRTRIEIGGPPNAPKTVSAVATAGAATVSWSAGFGTGLPATGYTVTASAGGATCTWVTGPLTCTVTGLTNGSAYSFTVAATNAAGTSPPSAPSNVVVPKDVPGAPTGPIGTAGKNQVTVRWTAPVSNGGSAITGYTVTASPGGATCSWTSGPLSCVVIGLTAGTSYTFSVTATNSVGQGVASASSIAVTPWDGAGYHPVAPSRILDSRSTNGGWNVQLEAGTPRDLQVTGRGGASNVPSSASAVVMNVTVTRGSDGSFVTLYPTGAAKPNASNLNFGRGQTIANLVTVKLGTGGAVTFSNEVGLVDVIADVVGYYDDGTGPGDLFQGITPTRLLDSRTTNGGWNAKLTAGYPRDLLVRQPANPDGIPATATAVIANVTVTEGTAGSFLKVWPSGLAQPNVSNLNFARKETIPNLVVVRIGSNGAIRFANEVGGVDVVVDVVGYFDPTSGSRFHAIVPKRILDDRYGTGLSGPWGPAQTRALSVAGATGTNVPTGATGLIINVTVTEATSGSFVTVFPDGLTDLSTSNLNFGPRQTIPNLVTVRIAGNGKIALYNELGTVDIIADAVGYYAAT